jgi:hypothetical protein
MIFALWHYLKRMRRCDYLPPLPRHLRTEFNYRDMTRDDDLMLAANHAGDVTRARRMLRNSGLTAAEYARQYRRQSPTPNVKRRLISWLRRLDGSFATESAALRYCERPRGRSRSGVYEVEYDK